MGTRCCIVVMVLCVVSVSSARLACADATQAIAEVVRVDTTPAHKITTFSPLRTFGGTVDKEPAGTIPALYSKGNVQAMLDAGLGWLSYRLFTELSDQDWHWNPAGSFSGGNSGYWTSSASMDSAPVSDSYGYRLPHRGNTTDQGNNESYSRLDDGNAKTYWKSNPYLTSAFTGDSDELHPQWVVIDLEEPRTISEIKIAWANPYATRYSIDYWIGDDPIGNPGIGKWSPIAAARLRQSAQANSSHLRDTGIRRPPAKTAPKVSSLGPVDTLHTYRPTTARYLRLLMTQSSNTCDTHGASDTRNCVGYAIAEVWAGNVDASGKFHDFVRHAACGGEAPGVQACGMRQTATYVSSVDPWHRSTDRVRNQEQPGLDLIARSGLTRGLPAMYPVAMLYSTPANAVAEVRYLQARGYPISYVELGEEPDGQYAMPEDDATLYVQWAHALHQLDPTLKLGGPVFSGVNSDLETWPDADGNVSWLNRFLNYLKSHGADGELAFMSFEHYPHDNGCIHGAELQRALLINPSIIKGVVNAWHSDGIPASIPLFITEANFSSVNYSQVPMQIQGALWQADYMASALTSGVSAMVHYQYEPVPLAQNKQCPSDWGNLTMFVADQGGNIRARGAQFYAVQMLTQQWVQAGDGNHDLFPAATTIMQNGYPLMTAYVTRRPDGLWSVMLVNKDVKPHDVTVDFADSSTGYSSAFSSSVTRVSFGSTQYVWQSRGANSIPSPDNPPEQTTFPGGPHTAYTIPAQSITVLRGVISPTEH